MLVYQQMSIGAIARKFTEEKVPTRTQIGHWERSVVWGILRNPACMGKAAYRKTQSVDRVKATKLARERNFYPQHAQSSSRQRPKEDWIFIDVPALISADGFHRVAQQLEENKKLSPRNNPKYPYLLSGLLRCKECGYSMYGKPASNSRYKRCYYRCMGQDGSRWPSGRVCSCHPVRGEVVDELVWEQVNHLLEQPEIVLEEYTTRINAKKRGKLSFEQLIGKKKKEICQQEREKERLLDLYQRGTIQREEIEGRLQTIRQKIQKLQEETVFIEKEAGQELRQLKLIEQFEDFKEKIWRNLEDLKFEEKKRVVRLLVEEVIVDTQKEEIFVRHIIPTEKSFPLCTEGNNPAVGESLLALHV